MKAQNVKSKLDFNRGTILELNNLELMSIGGGTFSTNSETGFLCDMIDVLETLTTN